MRICQSCVIVSPLVVALAVWYSFTNIRPPGTVQTPSEVTKSPTTEEPVEVIDLSSAIARYQAAKNWPTKCKIAKTVARSNTRLWEECGRRRGEPSILQHDALSHFVSAYYQRGPDQQSEIMSLLTSQDVELVWGLLQLLTDTFEPTPDGMWQPKRLGGRQMARHIANVYNTHPQLYGAIADALSSYGDEAKGEVCTLLRIILRAEDVEEFTTKLALAKVDEPLYQMFGLDPLESLTPEQRAAIVQFLAAQEPLGGFKKWLVRVRES